jgi:hypothetical protein
MVRMNFQIHWWDEKHRHFERTRSYNATRKLSGDASLLSLQINRTNLISKGSCDFTALRSG